MKINQITYCLFSIIAMITFLSYGSGPGNADGLTVTTAPGENGNFCGSAGCHVDGSFAQMTSIEITDNLGEQVTEYEPGQIYTVSVVIEASSGQPAGYGFQMVSLTDADDGNAGTWDLSNTDGVQIVSLLDRMYVEHNSPKIDTNAFLMDWEAPEAGAGPVTFYAAGNAVNLNGTNLGDGADTVRSTLQEAIASSVNEVFTEREPHFTVFPNPARNLVTIKVDRASKGWLRISDLVGRSLIQQSLGIESGQVDVSSLKPGIYLVTLFDFDFQTQTTRKLYKE